MLIERQHSINRNLEGQLQTIYKEKFSGNNNGILSNISSYSTNRIGTSSLSLDSYCSTENLLADKRGMVRATSLPTTSKVLRCLIGDTVISNIRPYFKKIAYCTKEIGCSADVLCFTPKDKSLSLYLFDTLFMDQFFDYMVLGSHGTKMPRGDKSSIMKYPIHIPSESELSGFNQLAQPTMEMICKNKNESKALKTMRDSLLPRLLSGELDVSDIDLGC